MLFFRPRQWLDSFPQNFTFLATFSQDSSNCEIFFTPSSFWTGNTRKEGRGEFGRMKLSRREKWQIETRPRWIHEMIYKLCAKATSPVLWSRFRAYCSFSLKTHCQRNRVPNNFLSFLSFCNQHSFCPSVLIRKQKKSIRVDFALWLKGRRKSTPNHQKV